jgi:ATP-binding protein involved in chromosome partitioning
MMENDKIKELLDSVVHPETGQGLMKGEFVESISASNGAISVVLKFKRARDPFAASLRRQAEGVLSDAFPSRKVSVEIFTPEKAPAPQPSKRLPGVKRVIAVASGKGGVGKSTVAAHLAATLAAEGYKVGILDADIYGPSQPALFGVSDYLPVSQGEGADAAIVPAESAGVKIMSIGFFISPSDALVWRGPMAVNALRQLTRQTVWGDLDFMVVDLPPGTGDVHLSLVHELEIDGAVIVSTPQNLAVADVRRGVEMFRTEGVAVPILGVVENMAWFTPAELPDNRYFIFGERGARLFAEEEKIEFLGDIPIIRSVMESGERGLASEGIQPQVAPYYSTIARKVVDKLSKGC